MNIDALFNGFNRSPLFRLTVIALITLAWSDPAAHGRNRDGGPGTDAAGGDVRDSAIHDAAGNGDLEKVRALLQERPGLVLRKDRNESTPLHYAMLARKNIREVTELLLANKADVNAKDKDDLTPLHWAASEGHKDVAALLLAHQADVNARTHDGRTPLHFAVNNNCKDVVELLLANKADVNVKNRRGVTPLQLAEKDNFKELADLLRQHGAK